MLSNIHLFQAAMRQLIHGECCMRAVDVCVGVRTLRVRMQRLAGKELVGSMKVLAAVEVVRPTDRV